MRGTGGEITNGGGGEDWGQQWSSGGEGEPQIQPSFQQKKDQAPGSWWWMVSQLS